VSAAQWQQATADEIEEQLIDWAGRLYEEKERELGPEQMRQMERLVMLRAVDTLWMRHLTELDTLREGIGLRAYGQQDPLVSFKKEAHELYADLTARIQENIVHSIYHVRIVQQPQHRAVRALHPSGAGDGDRGQPVRGRIQRVGRNDPCPCGSGKKYKHCCMRKDKAAVTQPVDATPTGATATKSKRRRKKRR
jgi:preprotein translocase subunit SecA